MDYRPGNTYLVVNTKQFYNILVLFGDYVDNSSVAPYAAAVCTARSRY